MINLIGNKYGMLLVVKEVRPVNKMGGKMNRRYRVLCGCGTSKEIDSFHLTRTKGCAKSCGCVSKRKLFQTKSTLHYRRLYNIWHKMKSRCETKTCSDYHKYGERGISVSNNWKNFENFYDDMIDTYKPGLTIERVNVNGNYCKENCIWIPSCEQAKNRRTTVWVGSLCAKDFCIKHNYSYYTFLSTKKRYGLEKAVTLVKSKT